LKTQNSSWTVCLECDGLGNCTPKHHPKVLLRKQRAVEYHQKKFPGEPIPEKLKEKLYKCSNCDGAGVVQSEKHQEADFEKLPRVAIVGGGIGGVALAVACLHRGIPFTLYERDESFDARSQGYGLTLQQARKALEGFGIISLERGLISTRHVVHNPEGEILGEWGTRNWEHQSSEGSIDNSEKIVSPKTNIHIARQSLRLALLEQLNGSDSVHWGHQLAGFKQKEDKTVELVFDVNGESKIATADLLVGADGVCSSVRNLLLGGANPPLEYLGCIVILGICPLEALSKVESELLDTKTVFQTANGHERIYVMPFDSKRVMWQLSFPISKSEAKSLSTQGAQTLKEEAIKRTKWHSPIPEMVEATETNLITGYPAYDRELLKAELLENAKSVTLLGDAAHPMSPFKGQGANQALLDALSLARVIYKNCDKSAGWKEIGLKLSVLNEFENEMIKRSGKKVVESAEAADFLHSEVVLREGNQPRGQ
jgi:2-polyprenyl-6-methoxyphenol hydroxylase-like FAD-dependent oxidoreductase